jgi:hypothetical protein
MSRMIRHEDIEREIEQLRYDMSEKGDEFT